MPDLRFSVFLVLVLGVALLVGTVVLVHAHRTGPGGPAPKLDIEDAVDGYEQWILATRDVRTCKESAVYPAVLWRGHAGKRLTRTG